MPRAEARSRFAPTSSGTVLACALAAVGLVGCSSSGTQNPRPPVSRSAKAPSTSVGNGRTSVVIKTRFKDFDGRVLAGSVIGGAPFCPGGTLHHARGSPEIGYPAINVFTCGTGQLRIGFGPGPDQMNNRIQTSDWRVLSGTGGFARVTGSGRMRVVFAAAGASTGRETFTGTVFVP